MDIILDTVIYSSTALLNLFEAIKEIKALKNNPKTEEEIDQELTKLAIYHLSTGNVLENLNIFCGIANTVLENIFEHFKATVQPAQIQARQQPQQQQIVQVKTEINRN